MNDPLLPVYAPAPVTPVRGEGSWLYEADGSAWLDCIGGVATNALGHCHPVLIDALTYQAGDLWHVSNALQIETQLELARRLVERSFADKVFFANTGTEAVECAIKMARRYHAHRGEPERHVIVGFHGSFHGRTYAALNAAGNKAYLDGFGPVMDGFAHVSPDDHDAVGELIAAPTTAALILEPVQGEGGARAFTADDLKGLREQCRLHGVLLIYDEVQSGMGRTGQLFAHQWAEGAEPDIMALAKALGCGFPVSACLATGAAAVGMTVGAHGSTFGGNPLAMAVAIAAFDEIDKPETLANVRSRSDQLYAGLQELSAKYPEVVTDLRGKGLLVGVRLGLPNRDFQRLAREERLLLAGGSDNIVRLLPALTISEADAAEALIRFGNTCAKANALLAAQGQQETMA